jgi:5-hydroxyisourate hydrolase-like protein (transthyretin family)
MKAILMGASLAVFAVPAMAQMAGGPAGRFTAPTTRAEAEAKAKERFAERDTNHDGFITADEIHADIMARMGERKDASFDRIDTDHNGTISREEYSARPAGPGGPRIVERHVERVTPDANGNVVPPKRDMRVMMMHKGGPDGGGMIMMSDTDHDGRISQAEAVAGALKLFDETDTNHDGTVTMDERRAAMEAWGAKMGKMHGPMGDMPPPPAPPSPAG